MSGGRIHKALKCFTASLSITTGVAFQALPAQATEVTTADLQAAVRSLGFLTSLQNHSAITIGVIYNGADQSARLQASRVAAGLAKLVGPGSSVVSTSLVAVQDISQSSQRFDALYLMPLPGENGRAVTEFVKRQNVVSISADPICLDMQTCVLLVQARTNTTVVLDTALAKAVGANFSAVFTMLVKRK